MIIVEQQPLTAEASQRLADLGPYAQSVVRSLTDDYNRFFYPSFQQLSFEVKLRQETIQAAYDLARSRASFATFYRSECNDRYWSLTNDGGFELRPDVRPSEAIRDIFIHGEAYAFECATAMMIVLYKAMMTAISTDTFDHLYHHLYLWDWHHHPFFPLTVDDHVEKGIPGDIRYFKNPEVSPQTPEWQGENAIQLPGQLYYGHGLGIMQASEIIEELNKNRRIGASIPAYLMPNATRPDYAALSSHASSERMPETIRIVAGTSQFEI